MAKIRKSRVCVSALCYSIAVVLSFFVFLNVNLMRDTSYGAIQKHDKHETINKLHYQGDLLFFIPQRTQRVWNKRDFLVVFGIPSLDIPIRRWRRRMQRTTCWQFPEVAKRDNDYTGAMLVLYALARHPINNFVISEQVVREAEQWQDIIILPVNEGRSSTNKMIDGQGYWGSEAEIGTSRKTFFWFQFALSQFPRVPYIAKGDDDIFLRVPQYLVDLRRLPLKGTYWGARSETMVKVDKWGRLGKVFFAIGYCMTLARDAAEQFVSYKPLQRIVSVPYSKERESEFDWLAMYHEDVMVGRVLNLTGYSYIFVAEFAERFYRTSNESVTKNSVVVHRPTLDEYHLLMKIFSLNATTTHDTVMTKMTPHLFFMDPPRETN